MEATTRALQALAVFVPSKGATPQTTDPAMRGASKFVELRPATDEQQTFTRPEGHRDFKRASMCVDVRRLKLNAVRSLTRPNFAVRICTLELNAHVMTFPCSLAPVASPINKRKMSNDAGIALNLTV